MRKRIERLRTATTSRWNRFENKKKKRNCHCAHHVKRKRISGGGPSEKSRKSQEDRGAPLKPYAPFGDQILWEIAGVPGKNYKRPCSRGDRPTNAQEPKLLKSSSPTRFTLSSSREGALKRKKPEKPERGLGTKKLVMKKAAPNKKGGDGAKKKYCLRTRGTCRRRGGRN